MNDNKYEIAIERVFNLHARALACHCECLGMNAENSEAYCLGNTTPYTEAAYQAVMLKWKLINREGELII